MTQTEIEIIVRQVNALHAAHGRETRRADTKLISGLSKIRATCKHPSFSYSSVMGDYKTCNVCRLKMLDPD